MPNLPLITTLSLKDKCVLLRFDGDVPVEQGKIRDDYRLQAVLPTIRWCRKEGARVILLCHRGRPKPGVSDASLSTRLLVPYFEKVLHESVEFIPTMKDYDPHAPLQLFENLRFFPGEERDDLRFAQQLARMGEIYCNDAFAVSHRAHASVHALAKLLPRAAGLQLHTEVTSLAPLRTHDERPYVVVLGGAKASDKSPIIADLLSSIDELILGGLVAITYLAAMGFPTGAHDIERDQIVLAQRCIREMHAKSIAFHVPVDMVTQRGEVKLFSQMTKQDLMLDIGPQTQQLFTKVLTKANAVFWNGAMGKFEDHPFVQGTIQVAKAIGRSHAELRIASGGDTVRALHENGLASLFSFVSTGGGATLEYLAGRSLPGIEILQKPA